MACPKLIMFDRSLLERSSDLSTVLRLNAINFERVLFILHLNWPSLTSKKKIDTRN